jgi:chromodomain-helicase-DNA-binding protein 1
LTNHSQEHEEEFTAQPVEQDSGRKRKAVSDTDREGRKAKRHAAKELSSGLGDDSEEESDPKQPLNPREIRNLYRAYTRYGLLDDCWNEILKDAGLEGRDSDVIKSTIDDLIRLSKEAVRTQRSAQGDTGKKEKKAVLFDYKGAKKLNAETLLNRPEELKYLKRAVEAWEDCTKFRIHDVKAVHNWSCEWGTREDSMLCVGIVKHGYGAWAAIRDDPELSMHNKFFLEEHRIDKKEERDKSEAQAKSPGAVHLVRRADYLLGVLKNKLKASEEKGRIREMEKKGRVRETEKKGRVRDKDDRSRGKEIQKRRREPEEAERKVRRRPSPEAESRKRPEAESRKRPEAESRKRRRQPDEDGQEVRHRPSPHSETRHLEVRRSNGTTGSKGTIPKDSGDLDLDPIRKHALVCALISSYSTQILTAYQEKLRANLKPALEDLRSAVKVKQIDAEKEKKAERLLNNLRTIGNWICQNSTKGTDEYKAFW